jgi:hypothetical protein
LPILFEPEQGQKLEILNYLLEHTEAGSFGIKELWNAVSVKSLEKLRGLLRGIAADFEDNFYQSEDCRLDVWEHRLTGFNASEYEKLKRYYFEKSTYFRLFDCLLLEKFSTADAIADECGLSSGQYYRAMTTLGERLAAYGIRIVNRRILGEEYMVRFIASHIYSQFLEEDSIWFNGEYQYCDRVMQEFLEDMLMPYPQGGRHWLACCFYITKQRIRLDHFPRDFENVLIRDNLFAGEFGVRSWADEFNERFLKIASNQAVLKLTPEVLRNEVVYFLHMIPMSRLKFKHELSTILKPEVLEFLDAAAGVLEREFNAWAELPMSGETRDLLMEKLAPTLLTVLTHQKQVAAEAYEALNPDFFNFWPVTGPLSVSMLDKLLKLMFPDGDQYKYRFWGTIMVPEFAYTIVSHVEHEKIFPEIRVCVDFSHAFNAQSIIDMLLMVLTDARIVFVMDDADADILLTNMPRGDQRGYGLTFFMNSLPSYVEWVEIKRQIVEYSSQKYYQLAS